MALARGPQFSAVLSQDTVKTADISGNGLDAILHGTTTPTIVASPQSGWGNALSTDGVEDSTYSAGAWITNAGAIKVSVTDVFALEVFKFKRGRTSGYVNGECLVSRYIGSSGANTNYRINITTGNLLQADVTRADGTIVRITGTTSLASTTNVYDAALTWDGTTLRLWLSTNGGAASLEASTTIPTGLYQSPDATTPMWVARQDTSTVIMPFLGVISGVRLSVGTSRGGAAWSPPAGRPSADSNTVVLLDFATQTTEAARAGVYDIVDRYDVRSDATAAFSGNGGVGAAAKIYQIVPAAKSMSATSVAAIGQANNKGWEIKPTIGMGSTASRLREVLANASGNVTLRLNLVAVTSVTGGTVNALWNVYKRSAAGVLSGQGTITGTSVTATSVGASGVSAGSFNYTGLQLAAGETLYVEEYVNISGSVTAISCQAQHDSSAFWQMGHNGAGTGIIFKYAQSALSATALAVAAFQRASAKGAQTALTAAAATLGPRLISKQALAATAQAAAIKRALTLFAKTATAAASAVISRNTGLAAKTATATAVGTRGSTVVGLNRSATAAALASLRRQFDLASKVGTATAVAGFSRFATFARSLLASATADATSRRQVWIFRSATATGAASKGQTALAVNRSAAATAAAAQSREFALAPKVATGSAVASLSKFITAARSFSASAAAVAAMAASLPQSVLARMVSGGGTVIRRVVNYIFDD